MRLLRNLLKAASRDVDPIVVRCYPWPFRAALAISNDCDFLTLPAALGLHQFLGSSLDDGGADIECSDSFFFYENAAQYPTYSYFNKLSPTPSAAAPVIRTLIRQGYLDTTHAWGDFENGGFRRSLAEKACRELSEHGLRLSVFSNHGGFGNIQNIGKLDFAYHHAGDDLASPYYVLDLIDAAGVRYFWTDTAKSKAMPLRPSGPVSKAIDRKPPAFDSGLSPVMMARDYRPCWNYDREEVLETFETRSGAVLQGFVRYDGFFPDGDSGLTTDELLTPEGRRVGPNIGRIAVSLTEQKLNGLIEKEACCFLYQHLSTLSHWPQRRHMTNQVEFHPENVEALMRLHTYHSNGSIWVAAQAILLDYLYMKNTIEGTCQRLADNAYVFNVTVKSGYEDRGFDGLTMRLPGPCQHALVSLPDGTRRRAEIKGPDEEGCYWACLPVRRLPRLDWAEVASTANIRLAAKPRITLLDGSRPVSIHWPGTRQKCA